MIHYTPKVRIYKYTQIFTNIRRSQHNVITTRHIFCLFDFHIFLWNFLVLNNKKVRVKIVQRGSRTFLCTKPDLKYWIRRSVYCIVLTFLRNKAASVCFSIFWIFYRFALTYIFIGTLVKVGYLFFIHTQIKVM